MSGFYPNMLDLNTVSTNSPHNLKESAMEYDNREPSGTNTELSGTSSTSSVVNAVESPASRELGFFRRVYSSPAAIYTHQLFPMTGGAEREVEVIGFGSSHRITSNDQQWLNLSVSGSGSGFEMEPPVGAKQQVKRSRRGPRSRSSQYRGVTFYRRTGRWESHIWDCGKQVYLGGFDTAHTAARAYDRAAIQFRGVDADINFTIADYEEDMKQTKNLNKEEFVQILRRRSNGFARGSSRHRGVTLPKCGRWEARTGQLVGNKAYDKAALQCNGREAIATFEPYEGHLQLQPNNNGGGDHNLDLNLGISMSINGPKESLLANGKRPLENDAELESVSSKNLTKWAWQMQSQGPDGGGRGCEVTNKPQPRPRREPVLLDTKTSAASSGFYYSPSTDYNNTILPFTNPTSNFFITTNSSSFRL